MLCTIENEIPGCYTGLHQERAYTCLGISCPQCVHHFDCFCLMHICISIVLWCTHWIHGTESMRTPNISAVCIEYLGSSAYKTKQWKCMRRDFLDWCMHCDRKYLNRCGPFLFISQCTYTQNLPYLVSSYF